MSETQKYEELDGQTVEYDLPFGGYREKAVGVFEVSGNKDNGTVTLTITRNYPKTEEGKSFVAERIPVPQSAVPAIQPHPDQAVARFRLSR